MRITICTGADASPEYQEMAQLCLRSIEHYCSIYPQYERRCFTLDHPDGKFSWDKINHLRNALAETDYVWWIDADAVIVGKQDVSVFLDDSSLFISRDENGINCGVMAWRNCQQSFDAFDRIDALYDKHKDHRWFEQAALMEFYPELSYFHPPKRIFNAYLSDVNNESLVLHLPAMTNKDRIAIMRGELVKLKNK